tara:strand:+ start:582 stop:1121 length:540 start_codon:yes stop_codon:yes gene_type:complete
MKNFLNLCASMPNMGAFVFYIIFVFITPFFLLVIKQDNIVLSYLTLLVPLAIIMDTVGSDRVFQNLYPENTSKRDPSGTASKYILNAIVLAAIIYQVVSLNENGNNMFAVSVGLWTLGLVFIFAPLLIPLVIDKADQTAKKQGINVKYDWHKYTVGFLMLVLIILLQVGGEELCKVFFN